MFETFDHTADLGLRITAPDEATLFAEAGRALTSILVENPDEVTPTVQHDVEIEGTDVEYLFFDWLSELLYRYESTQFLGCRFDVTRTAAGLKATVHGETLDHARHRPSHEVKAITYHGLTVSSESDGWSAEVIVDI